LGITVLFGVRGGREVAAAASDGFQQRLLAGRERCCNHSKLISLKRRRRGG